MEHLIEAVSRTGAAIRRPLEAVEVSDVVFTEEAAVVERRVISS